jgi:hypothetical protein
LKTIIKKDIKAEFLKNERKGSMKAMLPDGPPPVPKM